MVKIFQPLSVGTSWKESMPKWESVFLLENA